MTVTPVPSDVQHPSEHSGLLTVRPRRRVLPLLPVVAAVAPDAIAEVLGVGFSDTARLLMLAVLVGPVVVRRRLAGGRVPAPVLAYAVVGLLSAGLATTVPGSGVAPTLVLRAVLLWSVASVVWASPREARDIAFVVACVAPLSVIVGGLLELLNLHMTTRQEYTGVTRLQGATIPSFLAFYGTIGAAACLLLVHTGSRSLGPLLLIVDVMITVGTGTRGALLVLAVLTVPTMLSLLLSGGSAPSVGLVLRRLWGPLLLVLAVSLALQPASDRTSADEALGRDGSSGRLDAWLFFFRAARENPLFGRGLGAVTSLASSTTELTGDFRAAHNSYLELLVELGVVGGLLVIGSIGVLLLQRSRSLPRELSGHYWWFVAGFVLYSVTDNTLGVEYLLPFALVISAYGSLAAKENPS